MKKETDRAVEGPNKQTNQTKQIAFICKTGKLILFNNQTSLQKQNPYIQKIDQLIKPIFFFTYQKGTFLNQCYFCSIESNNTYSKFMVQCECTFANSK